jgi:hypothetical protein
MVGDPKYLFNDVGVLQLKVIFLSLRLLLEDLHDVLFGLGALPAS